MRQWSVLRLVVAGLAAGEAVEVAVLHQADVVLALAQDAIALAIAQFFRFATLVADELFRHVMQTLTFSSAKEKSSADDNSALADGVRSAPPPRRPAVDP
jgi:hypothetical protein